MYLRMKAHECISVLLVHISLYDSVGFCLNSLALYLMVLVTVQWDLFHEQSGAMHSNHRQGQKPKSPFFSHATFQM